MKRYVALLLASLVISCGGGGDGGDSVAASPAGTGGPGGGGGPVTGVIPSGPGIRVEETDPSVSRTGTWTSASSSLAWSGGSAVQSTVAGSTISFTFTGSAVRWIGSRGRDMGQPIVRIDGGPPIPVNLYQLPYDEARTTVITVYDLTPGQHTLTIEVPAGANNRVVVDAFEIDPGLVISRLQDTDPRIMPTGRDSNPGGKYAPAYPDGTNAWTRSEGSSGQPWSGNGAANPPELPVTAHETQTAGATVTLPFRGTGITWVGYRGPDAGIATVQIDGGAPVTVDLYSPTALYQAEAFTVSGLADTNHTITITATGQRNPAATAARVVVDAFDVLTPGRRYEQNDRAITYTAVSTATQDQWHTNTARVWTGGMSRTNNATGSKATFSFTGTSVSWIGSEKSSAGGLANVYIDGVFVQQVNLRESYPVEGYQKTVFRIDGLTPGPHTLTIEVAATGPYVVIDAFDVHP